MPQILIVVCGLSVIGFMAGHAAFLRRATLVRLNALLGDGAGAFDTVTGLLHRIGARLPGASDAGLQAAVLRAGYFEASALPVFVALRLVVTAGPLVAILLYRPSDGVTTLLLALFAAFFASRMFVVFLKLQAERRERGLKRELPPVVDVLLMVLSSGVSIDQSLRYATGLLEKTAPLSGLVLKRYIADIDSGMAYEAAFERMGRRFAISEGYDLANLIKQALLQGGEIMAALENFGAEISDKRVASAREQIGRKSVFLTLAMLAFFMPVLLITLGAPAVSRITRTLDTVKQQIHERETKR